MEACPAVAQDVYVTPVMYNPGDLQAQENPEKKKFYLWTMN